MPSGSFFPRRLFRSKGTPSGEEHRKARERKRRAECDAPRVGSAIQYGVKSLWESWRRAECAPGRTQDERGPPKAIAVA